MTDYVLVDTLESRKRAKPVYLGGMTGIGPRYTEDFDDAQRFGSKLEAMASPAYTHFLCFFEPEPVTTHEKGAKA